MKRWTLKVPVSQSLVRIMGSVACSTRCRTISATACQGIRVSVADKSFAYCSAFIMQQFMKYHHGTGALLRQLHKLVNKNVEVVYCSICTLPRWNGYMNRYMIGAYMYVHVHSLCTTLADKMTLGLFREYHCVSSTK